MSYTSVSKVVTYPNLFTTIEEFRQFNMQFEQFVNVAALTQQRMRTQSNPNGVILSINNTIESNGDVILRREWVDEASFTLWFNGAEINALRDKWVSLGWTFELVSAGPTPS